MKKLLIRSFIFAAIIPILSACNGFFDKDNTPTPASLTDYRAEIEPKKLWVVHAGYGSDDNTLRLTPAVDEHNVYTTSTNGTVSALNRINGNIVWQTNTRAPITSGPGSGDGIVVFGSEKGRVLALNATTGCKVWETNIEGQVLSNPAISHDVVVIKTMDGVVHGLSAKNGQSIWTYELEEPSLLLRAASAPLIHNHAVIVGFANGKLAKLNVHNGHSIWLQTIAHPEGAFSIQRMIDIDADPILYNQQLFAATYQGEINALDLIAGTKQWTHHISSYTGMAADQHHVYVSDAASHVWAFASDNGEVMWQQNELNARGITAPALANHYIVVGDAEGYLHWINTSTGHLAAREKVGSVISAQPVVKHDILYVYTNNGNLAAYAIR